MITTSQYRELNFITIRNLLAHRMIDDKTFIFFTPGEEDDLIKNGMSDDYIQDEKLMRAIEAADLQVKAGWILVTRAILPLEKAGRSAYFVPQYKYVSDVKCIAIIAFLSSFASKFSLETTEYIRKQFIDKCIIENNSSPE